MIYIAPPAGSGTHQDPYRPRGWDAAPGASWIELMPMGRDDSPSALFLLSVDAVISDARLSIVGADQQDKVADDRRAALARQLGTEPLRVRDTQGLLGEILLDARWCPLRPTLKGRIEAWLGAEKWLDLPHITGGASASSNFTGSENPLSEGGMWATGDGSWGDLKKLSGAVVPVSNDVDSAARLTTPTIGANQFSEGITTNVTDAGGIRDAGFCTRMASGADESAYFGIASYNSAFFEIARVNSSFAFTSLGTGGTPVSGRTLNFSSNGTSHILKENGVTKVSVTNAVIASGQPGLVMYAQTGNVVQINPVWTGGDLSSEPVRSMFHFRRRRV